MNAVHYVYIRFFHRSYWSTDRFEREDNVENCTLIVVRSIVLTMWLSIHVHEQFNGHFIWLQVASLLLRLLFPLFALQSTVHIDVMYHTTLGEWQEDEILVWGQFVVLRQILHEQHDRIFPGRRPNDVGFQIQNELACSVVRLIEKVGALSSREGKEPNTDMNVSHWRSGQGQTIVHGDVRVIQIVRSPSVQIMIHLYPIDTVLSCSSGSESIHEATDRTYSSFRVLLTTSYFAAAQLLGCYLAISEHSRPVVCGTSAVGRGGGGGGGGGGGDGGGGGGGGLYKK
jgi:hypothetical protein